MVVIHGDGDGDDDGGGDDDDDDDDDVRGLHVSSGLATAAMA